MSVVTVTADAGWRGGVDAVNVSVGVSPLLMSDVVPGNVSAEGGFGEAARNKKSQKDVLDSHQSLQ